MTPLVFLLLPLLTAILALAFPNPDSSLAAEPGRYERTFPAGPNSTLIIDNSSIHGNTDIQVWDRQEIKIEAQLDSPETLINPVSSEGLLKVKLQRKGRVSSDAVHFGGRVPPSCAIELSNINGNITVRGVRARLKALTSGGNIDLSDIQSDSLDVTSSMGGDITLSGPLNHQAKYRLYTSMGRIQVMVFEPASFTLDAVTQDGEILIKGFAFSPDTKAKSHVEGTYRGGKAILMLRTVGGVIQLERISNESAFLVKRPDGPQS